MSVVYIDGVPYLPCHVLSPDDRDTIGELAAAVNSLDDQVLAQGVALRALSAELRDLRDDTRRRHVMHLRHTHGLGLGSCLTETEERNAR